MKEMFEMLWKEVCDNVRPRVSAEAFERWFEPTRLRHADEKILEIAVPNSMHHYWMESNYGAVLADVVNTQLKGPRKLKFVIDASIAAALKPESVESVVKFDAALAGERAVFRAPVEPAEVALPETALPVSEKQAGASGLNIKLTFESFVIGGNAQFASAASRAVAEKPARTYNPLFMYGGVGLGKTHLLHAIGNHILAHKKKAKVLYVTSERFTNDFIDAIQAGKLLDFRNKYRKVDALLIDDIQFLAGKEKSQEEFFHTFNALFDGHKQIVLASDKPPSEIGKLEARLVSRFEWGITAQLQVPDVETRIAILRKKMKLWRVEVPDEIVFLLADRIKTNVRRLEGGLMRVASYASMTQEKLTPARVEDLLRDILQEDARTIVTVDKIQRAVAEYYDVRMADMASKRRPANIAGPRQIAMYLARELTDSSFSDIGGSFGGRDHGTVIHACKQVALKMKKDDELRKQILLLENLVKQPA